MIKKILLLLVSLTILLNLISCNDIIEPDLTKKTVVLVSPADGITSSIRNQTFIWEKIKETKEYRIQIASPNFTQIQALVLDSLVTSTRYAINLFPGSYQWRVRAENANSQSSYTTYSITIDSTSNLANITVILLSPNDSLFSNSSVHSFTWRPEENANKYVFELSSGSYYNSVITTTNSNNNVSFSSLADGWYKWGVQAQNDYSLSKYTYRNLLIDRVAPAKPVLVLPAINAYVYDYLPVTFTWTRANDNGSRIYDSLYIFTDSLWTNLAYSAKSYTKSFVVDSTKLTMGPHFWFVRAIDAAGNSSEYSDYRKFTIH